MEGTTNLTFYAKDKAGNTEDPRTISIKIDKSQPISQHSLTSDGQQSTFTLTATDAVSGVSEIRYSIDGGATQTYSAPFMVSNTGGHSVNYYSVDVAGNEEGLRTVYINPACSASRCTIGRGLSNIHVLIFGCEKRDHRLFFHSSIL